MAELSERWIQYEILKRWGAHPRVFMWRQNTGAAMIGGQLVKFGIPGACDIFSILSPGGRFAGIECKTKTGQQSKAQKAFQRVLEQHGGIYILARQADDVDRAYAAEGITR